MPRFASRNRLYTGSLRPHWDFAHGYSTQKPGSILERPTPPGRSRFQVISAIDGPRRGYYDEARLGRRCPAPPPGHSRAISRGIRCAPKLWPRLLGEVRELIRSGQWRGVTSGVAPGYVQANLAILRRDLAFDFLLFCQRNPKPCPLLEVVEAGRGEPTLTAPGADLRTDVAGYRVYEKGTLVAEVESLLDLWRDDLVSFLLGCSFSFEASLTDAGIPLRHQEMGCNVSMYISNIPTTPVGIFSGPMVVSMRPIRRQQVVRAVQVTSRFPLAHGAPVHIGDPAAIGIGDMARPDFGDPVEILPGEEPVFWACGATPQAVALSCKPSLMITHTPGRMFITDRRDTDYAVL